MPKNAKVSFNYHYSTVSNAYILNEMSLKRISYGNFSVKFLQKKMSEILLKRIY